MVVLVSQSFDFGEQTIGQRPARHKIAEMLRRNSDGRFRTRAARRALDFFPSAFSLCRRREPRRSTVEG